MIGPRFFWLVLALPLIVPAAHAEDAPDLVEFSAQMTNVTQFHPAFASPFRGPNSLDPGRRGEETIDATLLARVHLGSEIVFIATPEIDQGFGLSRTLGAAGFPSAEAYKLGASDPYFRLHRAAFRYASADGDIVATIGRFAVTDVFDTNAFAHDGRADFLNWSVVDTGTFDYAADPWGYTYGAAIECNGDYWSARAGVFDLSREPNSRALNRALGEFQIVAEAEWRSASAKLKLLAFDNRARMGGYSAALRDGNPPSTASVRRYASRAGVALNFEDAILEDFGVFLRAGINDGTKEVYEFSEINRTLSAGLSFKGARWGRADDTLGLAGVINDISSIARRYFAAGGLGLLIGDGRLPHYRPEGILEAYYKFFVLNGLSLSLDYQHIESPAYDSARGPAEILAYRLHLEF